MNSAHIRFPIVRPWSVSSGESLYVTCWDESYSYTYPPDREVWLWESQGIVVCPRIHRVVSTTHESKVALSRAPKKKER